MQTRLDYCPLDKLMTVVNVLEMNLTDSGVHVRFTYPQILLWRGDTFGYLDRLRVTDQLIGETKEDALKKIRQRLTTIYTWEHRKSYDGIAPIIPEGEA